MHQHDGDMLPVLRQARQNGVAKVSAMNPNPVTTGIDWGIDQSAETAAEIDWGIDSSDAQPAIDIDWGPNDNEGSTEPAEIDWNDGKAIS